MLLAGELPRRMSKKHLDFQILGCESRHALWNGVRALFFSLCHSPVCAVDLIQLVLSQSVLHTVAEHIEIVRWRSIETKNNNHNVPLGIEKRAHPKNRQPPLSLQPRLPFGLFRSPFHSHLAPAVGIAKRHTQFMLYSQSEKSARTFNTPFIFISARTRLVLSCTHSKSLEIAFTDTCISWHSRMKKTQDMNIIM